MDNKAHILSARPGADTSAPDMGEFRLRNFAALLEAEGELEVVEDNIAMIDVARHLDGNASAVLFKSVGPEKAELIGNVVGSRRRLALAFGVPERDLMHEVMRRLETPIAPVLVDSADAPVHQVILTGADADLTALPVHLQHDADGGVYISASIDVSQNEDGTQRNVGYRRMMVRGRTQAGIDLQAPSDLRVAYGRYVDQGRRLPVAFIIGSHPVDSVAAVSMKAVTDEVALMGALRQAPVPMVKCKTIDMEVPADAELVLEGYLDENGWEEPEGPYGEYLGYYGHLKSNPVFHLTAITKRRDALFQTATISGRHLGRTDTSQLTALRSEAVIWSALQTAVREPLGVYCPASTGGMFNARVSLRQRYPGEARNAIVAAMGSAADLKHVFVLDEDIDIYSDEQVEWALATRFQASRDLVVMSGFRAMPLDPSLAGARTGDKAGFDLTLPFGSQGAGEFRVPSPPKRAEKTVNTVEEALREKSRSFAEIMQATGSSDGRDTTRELDELRKKNALGRTSEGKYELKPGQEGG